MDPGRLPTEQILEEAHRREQESERRAELYAQRHARDGDPDVPARTISRLLHRVRQAIRGRR